MLDYTAIPISVWATTCPFILWFEEWLIASACHLLIVLLTVVVVRQACKAPLSAGLPRRKSKKRRIALLATQIAAGSAHAGWHYGYRDLWIAGISAYVIAFAMYKLVSNGLKRGVEPMSNVLPWHRLHWYGFHEDFHVWILVADVTFAVAAIRFLSNPEMDCHPYWRD